MDVSVRLAASFNLRVSGIGGLPPKKMEGVADFVFQQDGETCGIFVFVQHGALSGVELCGYSGDAPKSLPDPNILRQPVADKSNSN